MSKAFGGVKALDDVDFDLVEGEVHALVGGNGAGKSTLMKILTGVYQADAGTIKVAGKVGKIRNPTDAMRNGIRMVYQELSLIPYLTVAENIFLNYEPMRRGTIDKALIVSKTEELLKELGIDLEPHQKIVDLSVGYCQLVEIAKALSAQASILVFDEPTASLTSSEVDKLFELIRLLKSRGVSIVYISHRMKEIFEISDRITVLKDGRKVMTARTEDLDIGAVIDAMIGKAAERNFEWTPREVPVGDEVRLEVEHLSGKILSDVSFSLNAGEVLGIAGLIGSGRTELLEILFGLRQAAGGRLRIKGKDVRIASIQDAIGENIALVPEDRRRKGLALIHSVKDNILIASLKKVTRNGLLQNRKATEIVEESVAEHSIKTGSIDTIVGMLSGGNQQKVLLSKWLNTHPDILLLNEPTAGVDIASKAEIINFVRQLSSTGTSAILVSSEIAELLAVCDRILVLNDGRVVRSLKREAIQSEEEIQHAIQG
ncbi:sugar ABC transporter ATP-binding protein [Rhodobium gokarnense]|uniref:Ribose transport system ATP-binding protein n=1 Tax=Rhodobium gokarnense TaxID=364296 RepID=A0ABT3HF35_9HYPH|nr:sugar ABC transporter ATP-binding protein [Rhodobium gokarnense]MCW2308990.1 ribose transport system ATP-binding protein [Rhodobium gokarnense]